MFPFELLSTILSGLTVAGIVGLWRAGARASRDLALMKQMVMPDDRPTIVDVFQTYRDQQSIINGSLTGHVLVADERWAQIREYMNRGRWYDGNRKSDQLPGGSQS